MSNASSISLKGLQLVLLLFVTHLCAAEPQQSYSLWIGDRTDSRSNYEIALAHLALEQSADRFGSFSLTYDKTSYSLNRRIKNNAESPSIVMTINPYQAEMADQYQYINYPLMSGLLGYRKVIVHRSLASEVDKLATIENLRKYSIGQGPLWVETTIYRHNKFEVVEADFSRLLAMVANKRFDLLPLGISELSGEIGQKIEQHPDLVVPENLIVYYPHPVLMQVDKRSPEAKARLTYGIKKIIKNGMFKALFMQHFSQEVRQLNQQNNHVIKLTNPVFPPKLYSTLHHPELIEQLYPVARITH